MPKLKCPDCQTIFEANTENPYLSCPNCKATYQNPYCTASNVPATVDQLQNEAQQQAAKPVAHTGESKFNGKLGSLIGLNITNFLLLLVTIGFATPYVICRNYRWKVKNEIIDGNQLVFTGKAGSLFGQWIKWCLLTVITLGIYGFWIPIKKQRWITEHTHIA